MKTQKTSVGSPVVLDGYIFVVDIVTFGSYHHCKESFIFSTVHSHENSLLEIKSADIIISSLIKSYEDDGESLGTSASLEM